MVSRFNSLVTEQLLQGALDLLRRQGCAEADVEVYRCPGTFELPALLQRVAAAGRHDAVVALGCVIRGGTPHFEYVAGEAAKGMSSVALDHGIPVIFGVLTTDTIEQAIELGADAYVTKPVSLEELEGAMRTAFQKHGKM